jgi:hypothetical protein
MVRSDSKSRKQASSLGFRGIITKKEGRDILRLSKLYRRTRPVRAIKLTKKLSVESRTGIIETGYPGDYLVADIEYPDQFWIVRREVFETEFEPVVPNGIPLLA